MPVLLQNESVVFSVLTSIMPVLRQISGAVLFFVTISVFCKARDLSSICSKVISYPFFAQKQSLFKINEKVIKTISPSTELMSSSNSLFPPGAIPEMSIKPPLAGTPSASIV